VLFSIHTRVDDSGTTCGYDLSSHDYFAEKMSLMTTLCCAGIDDQDVPGSAAKSLENV
jgi:hypothetical protein